MIYAQHFEAEEFREWSDDMSARLITMLDVLRFKLGSPIAVSASEYALGRELGRGKMSEHNAWFTHSILTPKNSASGQTT